MTGSDARIGQQGSPISPQGNLWGTGTNGFAVSQTFAFAMPLFDVNTSSQIYCKNQTIGTNTKYPQSHSSLLANSYSLTLGIITATGGEPGCLVPSPNNCGGGGWGQIPPFVNANPPTIEILKKTIGNGISPFYGNEQKWIEQDWIFNSLRNDSSMIAADTTLENFYNQQQGSVHEKFVRVNEKTLLNDFQQARQENNLITTSLGLEQSKQTVNDISLKSLEDTTYVYSSADSVNMLQVALQCPYMGGDAVFSARAWYNQKTNRNNYYPDNCSAFSQNRIQAYNNNEPIKSILLNVYPNPTNGDLNLQYDLGDRTNALFEIFDLGGKVILAKTLSGAQGQTFVDISELGSGLYYYRVKENNLLLHTGKIAVQK
jgi:hypothetical protein